MADVMSFSREWLSGQQSDSLNYMRPYQHYSTEGQNHVLDSYSAVLVKIDFPKESGGIFEYWIDGATVVPTNGNTMEQQGPLARITNLTHSQIKYVRDQYENQGLSEFLVDVYIVKRPPASWNNAAGGDYLYVYKNVNLLVPFLKSYYQSMGDFMEMEAADEKYGMHLLAKQRMEECGIVRI